MSPLLTEQVDEDTSISTFAEAQVVLAESLPGYEPRPQQMLLARGIEEVFDREENFTSEDEDFDPDPVHFLGQAGCGTGKAYAYLIPALLSGKRVVVSVTTKALQEQIAGSDLPFLEEHLPITFSWALLKGRTNYLCLQRAALTNEVEVPELAAVLAYVREHESDPDFQGLREQLPKVSAAGWALLCSDPDQCSDLGCNKASDRCYAARARERAAEARVVLVNHSLLCTDLLHDFLPSYDAVVIDEAAELEAVASEVFGGQLSEASFLSLTAQVRSWASQHADSDTPVVGEQVRNLNRAVWDLFDQLEPGGIGTAQLNDLVEELTQTHDAVSALGHALRKATYIKAAQPERAKRRKRALLRQVETTVHRLTKVIADPFDVTVRWVEVQQSKRGPRKIIRLSPVLVAPFLRESLFSRVPCVLVSATMVVKGSFDYIAGRLGIDAYNSLDVGTPFDFPVQGRLYVPLHLPEPTRDRIKAWESGVTNEILQLIRISRGRALVLFTSVKHMRETASAIRSVTGSEFDISVQGERGSGELIEWLRAGSGRGEQGKVLFATKSFFSGVDVPGAALSLVVVVKMPFPVPTEPVTQARCEAIEAKGGNSFADYTIPVMSLTLQQACGRLIRHRSDRGVVALLDPRIVSKGYGRTIMADLPDMKRIRSIEEVAEFLT